MTQYTKMTNKMQLYRIIYDSLAALHVSSDIFAHQHKGVLDIHGSVHRNINLIERINKTRPYSRIYYFIVS